MNAEKSRTRFCKKIFQQFCYRFTVICLSIFFLPLASCSSSSSSSLNPPSESVSTDGLGDDFFNDPYFPHPDDWADSSSHGVRSKNHEDTINDCLICHDRNSTDLGSSGISGTTQPAGCKSCHSAYPHDSDWGDSSKHGQYVTANGTGECSSSCHGIDLSGGLSGISCTTCHAIYPHDSSTWEAKENHGKSMIDLGASACTGCHGENLDGGTSGIACTTCHPLYPHSSSTWDAKSEHGIVVINGGADNCRGCHGADLTGADTTVSCTQCHASYPHSETWTNADQHGVAAKGSGKRLCVNCHGAHLTGGDEGVSCYQCHTTYPHDNNSVPWTYSDEWGSSAIHGEYVLENSYGECAGQCHGSDLNGGLSDISCLTGCHDVQYPHPATWNDTTYKGTNSFHGNVGGSSGKTLCMGCHGSNLDGGTSGVSCYECHNQYPHNDENWVAEGMENSHAITFIALVQSENTAKCTICHGENYDREVGNAKCTSCHPDGVTHTSTWGEETGHGSFVDSNGVSSCQDCHGSDLTGGGTLVSCYQCHTNYPHGETWESANQHGLAASGTDKYSCTSCHGDNLTGGTSGVSCYHCHESYPHNDSTVPWSYTEVWSDATAHGQYAIDNGTMECAGECHGSDFNGGLSGVSCLTSCHTAPYPHPTNWNEASFLGTTSFHGSYAAGTDKDNCKSCHGESLTGGTSGVSCFSCHEGYPHVDANWVADGMASVHATTFIDLVADGHEDQCKVCHGESYDRDVGDGVSCTNCHTNGITHTADWEGGVGHGTFFSSHYTADDPDQYCQDCHGAPQIFTDSATASTLSSTCSNCHALHGSLTRSSTQTQEVLRTASSCYSCHWAYPHIGYIAGDTDGTGSGVSVAWGPNEGDLTGSETGSDHSYYGHIFYQVRSPLFTDESGNMISSPTSPGTHAEDIIVNTCAGGTSGSCHFEGNRSTGYSSGGALCGLYCHTE